MNALRGYYFFVFAMYAVVIPHYQLYLSAIGYPPRIVGLVIGFFEIAGVAGPIVFGRIADRTGRFREIKIACTSGAAILFAVILADLPLPFILLISAIAGFLFKTSVPLTDAIAGTVLADPREEYGKVRVFGSIGFAAASLAIPAFSIIDPDDEISMLIAFLIAIAAVVTAVLIIPPPTGTLGRIGLPGPEGTSADRTSTQDELPRIPRTFWFVIAALGVGNVAFGAYNSFFSLYLKEVLGIVAVTVYWAIGAISEIPIVFFSGRIIRRYGIGPLLLTAGVVMMLRMLLYATRPTASVVVLIQLFHAISFGLMLSGGIAYVNRAIPIGRRGVATTAFNSIGIGLPVFVGAALGGQLVEVFGYTGMYATIAIFPAMSAALFILLNRRDPLLRRDQYLHRD